MMWTQPILPTQDMVLSTEWSQLDVIDLETDNGRGMGFTIVGGQSTGVVVKNIVPGGSADRDGRLQCGDHILQIGSVNVRSLAATQVATVLRQTSNPQVRLIVARPVDPINYPKFGPNNNVVQSPNVPGLPSLIVRTTVLTDPEEFNKLQLDHLDNNNIVKMSNTNRNDVIRFNVKLPKFAENGLGMTIAGYVCRQDEDVCGIFVRHVTDDGAARQSGNVNVNDRIVAVNGRPLDSCTNQQAIEMIKTSCTVDNMIVLTLERQIVNSNTSEITSATQRKIDINPESTRRQFIVDKWCTILNDPKADIYMAHIRRQSKCLGVSLEGTVNLQGDIESHPHHYIRTILPAGPIGMDGTLKCGDELLEVNGRTLRGTSHLQVIEILQNLPIDIEIVCLRPKNEQFPTTNTVSNSEKLMRSRSLTDPKMIFQWSDQINYVSLIKSQSGLGFSIFGYQDPIDPRSTMIVIQSLVVNGAAHLDGRLEVGDRLISINDRPVSNVTLDHCIDILKHILVGETVHLGITKVLVKN